MTRAALIVAVVAALAFPVGAGAAQSLQIRHVDLARFPLVRVTAVAPAGARPTLLESGRPAAYAKARELGSAEAVVLALDNSESMYGTPLAQAKRAAGGFLNAASAGSSGLVVFGHEALALTRAGETTADVEQTLASVATDQQPGTALYDAVTASVARLQAMPGAVRLLVLLTDGRDVGSKTSLAQAIAKAQHANVVVYAIAAGTHADTQPLEALARATGGNVFAAGNVTELARTYDTLRRELDHTWQISYLTTARPGDHVRLGLRAGSTTSTQTFRIPGGSGGASLLPRSIAHSPLAAAIVVVLAGLLIAIAGVAGTSGRRSSAITRLLEPHFGEQKPERTAKSRSLNLDSLFDWTERSIADLPGRDRLERQIERSGWKLRLGHVPFLAVVASFFLGIAGTIMGAGPFLALLLMLIGLLVPFGALRFAAHRRTKAFDRQLPDVLASVASTLRAGHGLRTALRAVADDGSPPASEEFTRVLGEERLGRALDEAIAAMCERVGSPDLEYVATAINVHSQTGGSLAGLFDTLSETVRERQRHARRVRALTSMGRMSATVLICLPFGLATLMTLIDPPYMKPLFTTTGGHLLMGVCIGSMTLGALVLKRIVNVRF